MTDAQEMTVTDSASSDELMQRIGALTRMLRQSMRELGLNKEVEKAAAAIPDARARLDYVASMTRQAAERSLNAIDRARPLQDELEENAVALSARWDGWFGAPESLPQARELVLDTRAFLSAVPASSRAVGKELLEITMAQDFQDLTGQVIKKMMEVIQEVEHQLMQVLLESVAEGDERDAMQRRLQQQWTADASRNQDDSLKNGPAIQGGGDDVVSSQDQVDALLDELGF